MRALPICAARKEPPRCPPPPPPCPPPPPPRASASIVRRGMTRSRIAAMQAPVVNTNVTALQDWTRRTAAVGWALAHLHERRASNIDTGVFPSVAPPDA